MASELSAASAGVRDPDVSVVVATRDRSTRLEQLLATLAAQTLVPERFEIIVVDDGSTDATPSILDRERTRVRPLRNQQPAGPAAARNLGWRAARGAIVAFIDDDCVAADDWLELGLEACAAHPGAIVQGRVDPIPSELELRSPLTRTLEVHGAGPYFQTCNIFYPRAVLERLGGFDPLFTMPGGEDTDLAWRAIAAGAPTAFAGQARAFHAVNRIGLRGRLRVAAHWHESLVIYKRHPGLRAAVFSAGIFWKPSHRAFVLALASLLLPRRLAWLRPRLVLPYARSLRTRCRSENGRTVHLLVYPLEDAVELVAAVRASIRYRMLVL